MQFSIHKLIAQAALEGVCQRLAAGDVSAVLAAGLTIEEVKALQNLRMPEWQQVVQHGNGFVRIDIDHELLQRVLERVELVREEDEQQNLMLRMLAPLPMMREIFGMHSTEYSGRRKMLGLEGTAVGRPPSCEEATEVNVWTAWQETEHIRPLWLRFVTVAEATEKPLNVIWQVVRRHEEVKEAEYPDGQHETTATCAKAEAKS